MKNKLNIVLVILFAGGCSMAGIIFQEDFDPTGGFTQGGIYTMSLGGDVDTDPVVEFGQVGRSPQGSLVNIGGDNGNVLRVSDNGVYSRLVGFFIDPANFGGIAGTYTLEFDVLNGTDQANAYAWIYEGSGYNLASNSTDTLTLDLAAPNNGALTGLTASGNATASEIATTSFWEFGDKTISLDFEYDGSSAIAVAIGGYARDFQVDNIQVIPEPATIGMVGAAGILVFLFRRLRV